MSDGSPNYMDKQAVLIACVWYKSSCLSQVYVPCWNVPMVIVLRDIAPMDIVPMDIVPMDIVPMERCSLLAIVPS